MDTKKLRQKILDLAIRGKLVPQDPNDEPASELLERIRAEKERLIAEGKIKRPKKSKTSSSESHYRNFEPPFEIPASWEWVRLGDICDVARGGSPRPIKSFLTENENGVNWIKIGDTDKDGKYINSTKEKIIPEGVSKSRIVHKGDFLLTNSMSFGRPYILNIDGCIHDGWLVISPIGQVFDKDFLYLLLSSNYAYEQFTDKASGSAVSNLNSDKVADSVFPLPPLAAQRVIAQWHEAFSSFMDDLENEKEGLLKNIRLVKSKILELAMQGKLVPQDPTDEPAAEMLKRINPKAKIITDNPHSWNIPNGWSIYTLKDIADIVTGCTPSKSNHLYYGHEYPFYKPQDLDKKIISEASEYLSEMGLQASRNIPKDSIAICCIGSIGKVGYINRLGATNQQINTIIPNTSFYPKFLYYYCNANIFQDIILSLSAAITISIVNKGKMEEIPILLPPLNEQKRIVAKIEELYSCLDNIEASLQS